MAFITVTRLTEDAKSHETIRLATYVNVDHIIRIDPELYLDDYNALISVTDSDADVYCLETANEVLKLVREAKKVEGII